MMIHDDAHLQPADVSMNTTVAHRNEERHPESLEGTKSA